MGLKENMDLIREAIECLEYPTPLPKGICKAYKEVFETISNDTFSDNNVIEEYQEFLIYYDRLKEEEEGLISGRYIKKRIRFNLQK